jgi:hypothetical protein
MSHASSTAIRPGTLLVVSLLGLGLAAAVLAIGYQRLQTRRCLDFYGVTAARRLSKAPRVELWTLAPAGSPGRLMATDRRDISSARGIVHLRRGLVEDAGFRWDVEGPADRLPDQIWDYALVFSDPVQEGRTAVVVDLDAPGGWLTVAGQPGRAGLARLRAGLAAWISATAAGESGPISR